VHPSPLFRFLLLFLPLSSISSLSSLSSSPSRLDHGVLVLGEEEREGKGISCPLVRSPSSSRIAQKKERGGTRRTEKEKRKRRND